MSFHAGYSKKNPPRTPRSSGENLKRKSDEVEDAENLSPNIKKSKDDDSVKKKRVVTRSTSNASTSTLPQPKRGSKLPARASKLPAKSAPQPKKRIVERNTSERQAKTPSKNYDRTSLLSPSHFNSSSKVEEPSSVMKFPKQCLTQHIRSFFERAPIKSEEEINKLINPKLKPKSKWMDFREKAKRQNEVIGDLKVVIKDTLKEYKHIQEECEDVEKTMEERYQSIRNTLKEYIQNNNELKKNESQIKSELEKVSKEYANQTILLKELQKNLDETVNRNQQLTSTISDFEEKLQIESDLRNQVEDLLVSTKGDLSKAIDDKVSSIKELKDTNEKKIFELNSEYKVEIQTLRGELERKQADLDRFNSEKEEMTQRATDARENVLKSQSELRESEFAAQRYKQDFERASSEIEDLKSQLAQKDADLRNTFGSINEMQRQASEEKAALRAELSTLQPRVFQLEEERLSSNFELSKKSEELLSVASENRQLKDTVEALQIALKEKDREVDESKIAMVQLNSEKEMREKCERREENERAERIAACAQLAATQTECEYRVREIETASQNEVKKLQERIQKAKEAEDALKNDSGTLRQQIVGLEGELSELNHALQHAEANHEAVTELSKVKGEVEVYKLRISDLEKIKTSECQSASSRIAELEAELAKGDIQRRKLHNLVQELRGNVRVFARVRPYLPSDGDDGSSESPINTRADNCSLKIARISKCPEDRPDSHSFMFDKVFSPSTSQENVFDEVSEFVQSALDGYNVCLFSYGQTGSGKTHTMQGSGDGAMRGIIPRAIEQVGMYKLELEEKGWEYSMEVSFIEIYNETIRDLLRETGSTELKHDIKKDSSGKIYVSDVTMSEIDPNDRETLSSIMDLAARHRSVAHTAMNAHSSRSHSVFTLHLRAKHAEDNIVLKGTLSLVDLAGSERLDRSEATGARMKETVAINKSLSSLTDVFTAIANKQGHIPFRNSKLTHLLQPALSGDGKALMMVNLSPTEESYHESLCSLRFASQVNQCELGKPKKQVKEASSSASSQGVTTTSLAVPKSSGVTRGPPKSVSSRPSKVLRK